jgi:hypothetical protein
MFLVSNPAFACVLLTDFLLLSFYYVVVATGGNFTFLLLSIWILTGRLSWTL